MLIPFANVVSTMTPSNRREADKQLAMAMLMLAVELALL